MRWMAFLSFYYANYLWYEFADVISRVRREHGIVAPVVHALTTYNQHCVSNTQHYLFNRKHIPRTASLQRLSGQRAHELVLYVLVSLGFPS